MKLKKIGLTAGGAALTLATCFSFAAATTSSNANEVLLSAKQPTKIMFKVVRQKQGDAPSFGDLQTRNVSKSVTIPIDLADYDLAGIVIIAVNDHILPAHINQFNQPKQCSMTTNKTKATGALEIALSDHAITCRTFGGIFG